MNIKKILQVIGAIVAIAGIFAAVYLAVKKLTDKKEPEYFDDNDFFECDNELEIIEVDNAEEAPAEEAPAEEKKAPKKKKAAKKAE
ncbi:MAG: PGF-CTERM sorting domain-containing protein [Eubacterium sp.]|nr:hypothetical protein [Eubacterium sp.]